MQAILRLSSSLLLSRTGNRDPFLTVLPFELPQAGVYTLEGPNGCGKSMLIRFLTGTLPGAIEQDFTASIEVDGKIAPIRQYRDALSFGLTSVFQDDDLISSMTVFENIVLRHGSSNSRKVLQYLWDISFNWIAPPLNNFARVLGPALSMKLQAWLEGIEPKKIDWKERRSLRQRATDLLVDHGINPNILDQASSKLSGGGRAAAKLISAQLYPNTRVLLLDEAFNGVERNIWPRFVDAIKKWSIEKGAAVIAITHSTEELQRWDPLVRYCINDGICREEEVLLHATRRRTTLPRQLSVPVFELYESSEKHAKDLWFSVWRRFEGIDGIIIMSDNESIDGAIMSSLERFSPAGVRPSVVVINNIDQQSVGSVIAKLESVRPVRRSILTIVGGSKVRILGSLAAISTQHLDLRGVIIVPTSFHDAVLSVTSHTVSVSILLPDYPRDSIHISSVFNPDAFVIPVDTLKNLSSDEIRFGLVPCLKLGALFDSRLFLSCSEVMSLKTIASESALKVFRAAVSVLNNIAELGPQSSGIGRVLQFGSFHSILIETVTNRSVVGGEALLLGMILEALISGSSDLSISLLEVIKSMMIKCPPALSDRNRWDELQTLYESGLGEVSDGKWSFNQLKIPNVAYFSVDSFRERLAATKGRSNRNLADFANSQAERCVVPYRLLDFQIALQELNFLTSQ